MGVQLELDGTKLVVDSASDVRWQWVFIGTAVVFFLPAFATGFPERAKKAVSGPKFILPAIDGSTVKQKLFLVALLVLAVAWPFMVSRGTVDIATLTMISHYPRPRAERGCWSFWSAGAGVRRLLRHRRLHFFALLNHYYGLGF